jgi:redox-sensitive bicupin YhaK (pirin superfamily)
VALTSPSDSTPIHLQPRDYHLIGPEDLGSSGLVAREAVGPFAEVVALGPLVTVHDSRFDPRSGIGHHPHHGMERLFYIVEGRIDHEDRQNDIQGTMGTGDLGILTEGEAGMLHSERNEGDEPARAYILVYPADPLPDQAAFDAIRDDQMPRLQPGEGLHSKLVVGRDDRVGVVAFGGDAHLHRGHARAVETLVLQHLAHPLRLHDHVVRETQETIEGELARQRMQQERDAAGQAHGPVRLCRHQPARLEHREAHPEDERLLRDARRDPEGDAPENIVPHLHDVVVASRRAADNASGKSSGLSTLRMPRPPPPARALISTG